MDLNNLQRRLIEVENAMQMAYPANPRTALELFSLSMKRSYHIDDNSADIDRIMQLITATWEQLPPHERQPFYDRAQEESSQYHQQMKYYEDIVQQHNDIKRTIDAEQSRRRAMAPTVQHQSQMLTHQSHHPPGQQHYTQYQHGPWQVPRQQVTQSQPRTQRAPPPPQPQGGMYATPSLPFSYLHNGTVEVVCKNNHGTMLVHQRRILCHCQTCSQSPHNQQSMSCTQFEVHSGETTAMNWRSSIRVESKNDPHGQGMSLGEWLDRLPEMGGGGMGGVSSQQAPVLMRGPSSVYSGRYGGYDTIYSQYGRGNEAYGTQRLPQATYYGRGQGQQGPGQRAGPGRGRGRGGGTRGRGRPRGRGIQSNAAGQRYAIHEEEEEESQDDDDAAEMKKVDEDNDDDGGGGSGSGGSEEEDRRPRRHRAKSQDPLYYYRGKTNDTEGARVRGTASKPSKNSPVAALPTTATMKPIKSAAWRDGINGNFEPIHVRWSGERCSICDVDTDYDSDQLVTCNVCCVTVHQSCYGIQRLPATEEMWLCRGCETKKEAEEGGVFGSKAIVSPQCCLCPVVGGALKPSTISNVWCHVTCLQWIPEVTVDDVDLMEPVEGIRSIPKERWDLLCILCRQRMGAKIQCDMCYTAYHPLCARLAGFKMNIASSGGEEVELFSYCAKHSTPQPHLSGVKMIDEDEEYGNLPDQQEVPRLQNGQPYKIRGRMAKVPHCEAGSARAMQLCEGWTRRLCGNGAGATTVSASWIPTMETKQPQQSIKATLSDKHQDGEDDAPQGGNLSKGNTNDAETTKERKKNDDAPCLISLPSGVDEVVTVKCCKNTAQFIVRTQNVYFEGELITPTRFEALSGRGVWKNWKHSLEYVAPLSKQGIVADNDLDEELDMDNECSVMTLEQWFSKVSLTTGLLEELVENAKVADFAELSLVQPDIMPATDIQQTDNGNNDDGNTDDGESVLGKEVASFEDDVIILISDSDNDDIGTQHGGGDNNRMQDTKLDATTAANNNQESNGNDGTTQKPSKSSSLSSQSLIGGHTPSQVVGMWCLVWWPEDKEWYVGEIQDYSSDSNEHKVWYKIDQDTEWIDLAREHRNKRLRLLGKGNAPEKGIETDSTIALFNPMTKDPEQSIPKEESTGRRIHVVCNSVCGILSLDDYTITLKNGSKVSPSRFEKLAGKGHCRNWSMSIRLDKGHGEPGEKLSAWLKREVGFVPSLRRKKGEVFMTGGRMMYGRTRHRIHGSRSSGGGAMLMHGSKDNTKARLPGTKSQRGNPVSHKANCRCFVCVNDRKRKGGGKDRGSGHKADCKCFVCINNRNRNRKKQRIDQGEDQDNSDKDGDKDSSGGSSEEDETFVVVGKRAYIEAVPHVSSAGARPHHGQIPASRCWSPAEWLLYRTHQKKILAEEENEEEEEEDDDNTNATARKGISATKKRAALPIGGASIGAVSSASLLLGGASTILDEDDNMSARVSLGYGAAGTGRILTLREKLAICNATEHERLAFGKSSIHGWGLFAKVPMKQDSMVVEFRGELVRRTLADRREAKYQDEGTECYIFNIDDDIVLDATCCGTIARFTNHSCLPSLYSKILTLDGGEPRLAFFARTDIQPGQELTYNYRFQAEHGEERIECRCGAPICTGYLN